VSAVQFCEAALKNGSLLEKACSNKNRLFRAGFFASHAELNCKIKYGIFLSFSGEKFP
jgi:hypothetical protein